MKEDGSALLLEALEIKVYSEVALYTGGAKGWGGKNRNNNF